MQFASIYNQHAPGIIKWIRTTLDQYAHDKIPVSALNQSRLREHFPTSFLKKTYVVYLNEVPVIPLHGTGVPALDYMAQFPAAGLTLHDTIFIRNDEKHHIGTHFHEMIHVLQWEQLGMEKFILCYAHGLLTNGYRNSPLEEMAYDLQSMFSAGGEFNTISIVRELMEPIEKLSQQLLQIRY